MQAQPTVQTIRAENQQRSPSPQSSTWQRSTALPQQLCPPVQAALSTTVQESKPKVINKILLPMKKTFFFTQQVAQYCISKRCYADITSPINKILKTIWHSIGCSWRGVGSEGAAGASLREDWDCPMPDTAGSRWLQRTHCRAQLSPSAKLVAPPGKPLLEGAKPATQAEERGGGGEESEEQNWEQQGQRRRRGKRCSRCRSPYLLQPTDSPRWSRYSLQSLQSPRWSRFFPEGLQPCGESPDWSNEKKQEGRTETMYWPYASHPSLHRSELGRGVWSDAERGKWGRKCVVSLIVFDSHYPNLFQLAIN